MLLYPSLSSLQPHTLTGIPLYAPQGMLKGDDLSAAYASADVFMMPSETETLGFVAMEVWTHCFSLSGNYIYPSKTVHYLEVEEIVQVHQDICFGKRRVPDELMGVSNRPCRAACRLSPSPPAAWSTS